MTNGTQTFFQEVLDALNLNNHPDLVLLVNLCSAVDVGNRMSARKAAGDLIKVKSKDMPLAGISPELYYELMARVLKLGWSGEFTQLMAWYEPLPSFAHTSEEKLVDNWIGVLNHAPEPEPGLTAGDLIRAWKSEIQCLQRALADLARIDVPVPQPYFPGEPGPTRGFGTAHPNATLEEQLREAVQHFFRNTHMLFQLLLERATLQLERDRTTELLRILRRLHEDRAKLLEEQKKLDAARAQRTLSMRIRITEIQSRGNSNLYLDAFRPYRSRNVPISSFDRDEKGALVDLPGLLADSHVMRDQQLSYLFDAYGEPSDARNTMTPALQRRQDLIRTKHRGQLKLGGNDDLVLFLTNLFEDTVRMLMGSGNKLPFADASAIAWRTVQKFLGTYLDRMTAHTSFDITEKPPNYLLREFPRSLIGGLLHECGVYAVRMAYVLLSMARGVDRIFPGTFDMQASWILLPLHVGLILDSRTLALLVLHNQSLFILPDEDLNDWNTEWSQNVPPEDHDPTDPDALQRKFLEDAAAVAFSNDLDMPILRFEVIGGKVPVTPKTIWDSYQRHVVPNYKKLFSPLVDLPRAKQYQFDLRYLSVMRLQKGWFNRSVVPFWNVVCREIFEKREAALVKNLAANKDEYVAALEAAIDAVENVYDDGVLTEKSELSSELRADPKLLRRGVRANFSERLSTSSRDIGPIGRVKGHVEEVKQPGFTLIDPVSQKVVRPPFALDEEALVRLPE